MSKTHFPYEMFIEYVYVFQISKIFTYKVKVFTDDLVILVKVILEKRKDDITVL